MLSLVFYIFADIFKTKKMKKLLISVFMMILVICQAQKHDLKSSKILETTTKKYKENRNSYFKFAYGIGVNGRVSKTQVGTFYTTPTQYRLKVMGVEQIFDGKKIYNISTEDSEVTITKAGNNGNVAFSPTSYLSAYKKDYNSTYVGKKNISGKLVEQVRLTPIKANGVKEVDIYIDVKTSAIVKIEQQLSDKSYNTITIQEYKNNQNMSPSFFTFNKANYKNYIITEL